MILRSGEAVAEYEQQAAELVALRLGESGEDLVLGFPLGMGGTVEPALAGGREGDDVPAPGAGELLVRVQASSVNPVDNAIAAGMLSGMGVVHEFPVTLGRDYAGVVEQVGAVGVEDQATLGVHRVHSEVLHSDALDTHPPGHPQSFEDPPWSGAAAD